MRHFLMGLIIGVILATAVAVGAFGHTPRDQFRNEQHRLLQEQNNILRGMQEEQSRQNFHRQMNPRC